MLYILKTKLKNQFISVPSAPPTSVQGHNLSSTSIFVSWGEVPPDDKNGVILSYTVTYRALPSGSEQMENVTAPNTTATLTGLNEYTTYSITVFASTICTIVVITDEDSKFSQHFMFLQLSIKDHNSPASSADSLCCDAASSFLIRL